MRTVQRPLLVTVLIVVLALIFFSPGCKKQEPVKKDDLTARNLQEARAFALKRATWYSEFAGEAVKERQPGAAALFRALARSEQIRAENHANVLRTLNVEPENVVVDTVTIGTSYQTLKLAYSCEMTQARSLYANMIRTAEADGLADISSHLRLCQRIDLEHLELLQGGVDLHGKVPQKSYILCPDCGYIMTSDKEEKCPVCGAMKGRFEKV